MLFILIMYKVFTDDRREVSESVVERKVKE